MKRWAWRILCIVVVLASLTVGAFAAEGDRTTSENYDPSKAPADGETRGDGNFTYKYSEADKGWVVTAYNKKGQSKSVKIPAIFDDIDVIAIGGGTAPVFGADDAALTGTVTIPNGVMRIADQAFFGAKITEIVIPGNVRTIGSDSATKGAFQDCKSLQNVTILDYVDEDTHLPDYYRISIGKNAFNGCSMLDTVVLSNSVTKIGSTAFYGCTGLQSIVIPYGVSTMGSGAFSGCTNLADVIFLTIHVDELSLDRIPFTNTGFVIHCQDNTDVYRYFKAKQDSAATPKFTGELHTFTKSSYQAQPNGVTAPRCALYGTKGTVGVTFNCDGYMTKVKETRPIYAEVPRVDKEGNPILDVDKKPLTDKVDTGKTEEVEVNKRVPCTHFNKRDNGTGGTAFYRNTRQVSMLWHTWVETERKEPTCTEEGSTGGMHCKYCPEVLKDPGEAILALGHLFGKQKVDGDGKPVVDEDGKPVLAEENEKVTTEVKKATCSEEGLEEVTQHCERCGLDIKVGENKLDRTAHEFVTGKMGQPEKLSKPNCTDAGLTVTHRVCSICGFSEADECLLCGAFEKAIKAGVVEWEKFELLIPEGWKGDVPTPTPAPAPSTPETPPDEAVSLADDGADGDGGTSAAADSLEGLSPVARGYVAHLEKYHAKEFQKFNDDDKIYWNVKYEVAPPVGHTMPSGFEMEVLTEPTCEEPGEGKIDGYPCQVCKKWVGEQKSVVIPALGHDMVDVTPERTKEPTCEEPGEIVSGIKECQREDCSAIGMTGKPYRDESGKKTDPIPALGHKWGDFIPDEGQDVTQAEDCREKTATGTAICERCGKDAKDLSEDGEGLTITIPGKLAHTWGEWVTTKEPTAAEPGTQKRTCKVCGEQEEKTVPAGGGASNPGTSDPGTSNPGTSNPGTADPGTSKPDPNAEYTVTVTSGSGGTARVSRTSAKAGTSVTVTVSPHSGFELDMIRVTGNATAKDLTGSQRSFTMPASNVNVTVSFSPIDSGSGWGGASNGAGGDPARSKDNTPVQITPQSIPRASAWGQIFSDIPTGHWAAGEINWANRMGYMNGTEGRFNPDEAITCQQMWMVLARLTGSYPANMADARRWAVEGGFADGSSPTAPVARHQLVTALYRCAYLKGGVSRSNASLAGYADSRVVPSAARDAFAWAVANGIVSGTSGNRLEPNGTLTRAQFAVILYRYSQRV